MTIDLDALEATVAKMTPGEWRLWSSHYAVIPGRESIGFEDCDDAAGIVALVNAAPELIAEIRWLRSVLQEIHPGKDK